MSPCRCHPRHDPPGGESNAEFNNARARTSYSHGENSVSVGVGVGLEGSLHFQMKDMLESSVCLGLGAAACTKVMDGMSMKLGPSLGASYDNTRNSGSEYNTLTDAAEYDITYSTSGDEGAAGPNQDSMLMPSATVQVSQVKLVQVSVSADQQTCTVSASMDTSFAVLMHLSGPSPIPTASHADRHARYLC